jgi:hypothetical protein
VKCFITKEKRHAAVSSSAIINALSFIQASHVDNLPHHSMKDSQHLFVIAGEVTISRIADTNLIRYIQMLSQQSRMVTCGRAVI